jgi:hypothetical protein
MTGNGGTPHAHRCQDPFAEANPQAVLFEDVAVPAGDYDWICFYLRPDEGASAPPLSSFLTSSYIEFKDGSRANLIIPGGLQAGLQLVSGFTVPEGGSVSFTVDFYLRNMIRPEEPVRGLLPDAPSLGVVDNNMVGMIPGTVDVGSYEELSEVAAICTEDSRSVRGCRCSCTGRDRIGLLRYVREVLCRRLARDHGNAIGFVQDGLVEGQPEVVTLTNRNPWRLVHLLRSLTLDLRVSSNADFSFATNLTADGDG